MADEMDYERVPPAEGGPDEATEPERPPVDGNGESSQPRGGDAGAIAVRMPPAPPASRYNFDAALEMDMLGFDEKPKVMERGQIKPRKRFGHIVAYDEVNESGDVVGEVEGSFVEFGKHYTVGQVNNEGDDLEKVARLHSLRSAGSGQTTLFRMYNKPPRRGENRRGVGPRRQPVRMRMDVERRAETIGEAGDSVYEGPEGLTIPPAGPELARSKFAQTNQGSAERPAGGASKLPLDRGIGRDAEKPEPDNLDRTLDEIITRGRAPARKRPENYY